MYNSVFIWMRIVSNALGVARCVGQIKLLHRCLRHQGLSDMSRRLLLLVAVLAQTLLALVRGHLMSLPFFSTRHDLGVLINYSVLRGGFLLLFWFLGWARVPNRNSGK
jgi:hypothetical protein